MVGWGLRTMHLTAPMEDPLARALPGLLYFAILVERSCHFSWNSGGVVVFGMAFLPWVALSSFHSEHCYWTHMGQAGLCLLGVYIATPEHRNREQTHFWQPRISSRYADGFILCFFALALTWIMEIAELWSSRDATSPSLLWFALSAAPGIVILLLGLRHILEALLRGNPLQEVCNWAFLQPVYGAAAVVGVVIWLFSLPFLLEHGDSGDWWMFLLMELPVLLGFLVLASMSMISNYLPSQPKSKDLLNDLLPPEWTSTLVRTWESPLLPIFLSLGIIAGIPALVMFGAGGFSKDAWPKHMQTSEFWQQMLFWTYVLSVALVGIGIGAAVLAKSRFRISKITLEDKIAFVLVFVLLGVVGVWLMTDVETYMLKAVAWARPSIPDLDPLEYVKVQIIPPKVEQKEDGLKFIEVPSEGFWPNSTDMESMRAQKADHKRCWFFLPWMAVKYISFGSQGSTREEALKGSIESNYVPLPRTSRASGAEQQAGAEGSFSEVSTPPKADRAKKPKAAASRMVSLECCLCGSLGHICEDRLEDGASFSLLETLR
ncbi:unnamed protein product [Symbiodinium sp. CCMP2592]|nr:unnamed protein product [Symbiodinium sp. CCMP2592]